MNLREKIYKALENVYDPEIHKNLIELDMIGDVMVEEGRVIVNVTLTTGGCPLRNTIANDVKKEVSKVEGVTDVEVTFGEMTQEQKEKLIEKLHGRKTRENIFSNTRVIAIGSGKGGVGKSTVTANLAVTMSRQGHKVGLIDADILGYSIPQIMGLKNERPNVIEGKMLMPLEKEGVKVMSMGNLVDQNEAFIWRGPMLGKVLEQFLYDVYWGELEYLLIDLPPGTGDVPLSLMQILPESEILIVTTPQITAASVAKRLGLMAAKTDSKVIGIIENMSYFVCNNCGEKHFIFGQGEGRRLSDELHTELLGEIPLVTAIREYGDKGTMTIIEMDHDIGEIYKSIARKLVQTC